MVDMGHKKCPQNNKLKSKMVTESSKTEEDVQYKEKEKRNRNIALEQLPDQIVNRIDEKKIINSNAHIIENNFSTPKRVAVISTFYKSEPTK